MTKKMTKKDYFNELLTIKEVADNEKLVAFIEHELELLAKKNTTSSGEKKMTATQKENEGIKQAILDFMKPNQYYTITEILKGCAVCQEKEMSNQRVSSLVRQLKDAEKVTRIEDKKRALFVKN
jgi:hypothetical protein